MMVLSAVLYDFAKNNSNIQTNQDSQIAQIEFNPKFSQSVHLANDAQLLAFSNKTGSGSYEDPFVFENLNLSSLSIYGLTQPYFITIKNSDIQSIYIETNSLILLDSNIKAINSIETINLSVIGCNFDLESMTHNFKAKNISIIYSTFTFTLPWNCTLNLKGFHNITFMNNLLSGMIILNLERELELQNIPVYGIIQNNTEIYDFKITHHGLQFFNITHNYFIHMTQLPWTFTHHSLFFDSNYYFRYLELIPNATNNGIYWSDPFPNQNEYNINFDYHPLCRNIFNNTPPMLSFLNVTHNLKKLSEFDEKSYHHGGFIENDTTILAGFDPVFNLTWNQCEGAVLYEIRIIIDNPFYNPLSFETTKTEFSFSITGYLARAIIIFYVCAINASGKSQSRNISITFVKLSPNEASIDSYPIGFILAGFISGIFILYEKKTENGGRHEL